MLRLKNNWVFLFLMMGIGLFPRLWRLPADLQVHYDQGLHSQGVWNIWHEGKFSLLGHPTDQDGIFHAPVYYWLMTPAYMLGRGDPGTAAVFQAFLCILAAPFIYALTRRLFDAKTARIALVIYGFSYGYASYARWLSNVTPAWLFSAMFSYYAYLVYRGRTKYLPLVGLLTALVFECNGAIGAFLYPLFFYLLLRSKIQHLVSSLFLTLIPHLPLLLFELRHNFIITKAFLKGSATAGGFSNPLLTFINNLNILNMEMTKMFIYPRYWLSAVLLIAGLILLIKYYSRPNYKFLIIHYAFFLVPLSFFNRGAIGFFLVPVILLSTILIARVIVQLPKVFAALLLFVFLFTNIVNWYHFVSADFALTPSGAVNLITNQDRQDSVAWIYRESAGQQFAVWIYIIPYFLYDPWTYYFHYLGQNRPNGFPENYKNFSKNELKTSRYFYAIFEPDQNQPGRLVDWLDRVYTDYGRPAAAFSSNAAHILKFDLAATN